MGYKACFGRELSKEEVDDLFLRVDSNGSGYIEYSEFLVAAMNEKDLLHSQRLQHAFSLFDKDEDGRISVQDLKEVLSHFKGAGVENPSNAIDEDIIEKIIHGADVLGTGDISYDEFIAMMLRTTDEAVNDSGKNGLQEGCHVEGGTHRKATMSIDSACFAENMKELKFTADDFVSHRPREVAEFYRVKDYIDEGGFGKVYLCEHKLTGAERAVKILNKSRWRKNENRRVVNEYNLLKELDHPNILHMYDLFEDRICYYIVADVCRVSHFLFVTLS